MAGEYPKLLQENDFLKERIRQLEKNKDDARLIITALVDRLGGFVALNTEEMTRLKNIGQRYDPVSLEMKLWTEEPQELQGEIED